MKHALVACLLIVGCAKDDGESQVCYRASCFACAVEAHDDGGRVFRDTLNGHITEAGDTVSVTWKANFMASDGDGLSIRACSLMPDSVHFPIVVSVGKNWVNDQPIHRAEVDSACVAIEATFHQ